MRRTSPVIVALLASACAVTGLPDEASVTPTTAPPIATLAPTSAPPTTVSPSTTTSPAPPATTTTAPAPSVLHTIGEFSVTTPPDWVGADLVSSSPTEAAITLRPLDAQGLADQITTLADAGGIFWAERADGTGDVGLNVLRTPPLAADPDLGFEAADIERQLLDTGATIEGFSTEEVTIAGLPAARNTFTVVGLFGSASRTQYLFGHARQLYVLTFMTRTPELDASTFASIAASVSFA